MLNDMPFERDVVLAWRSLHLSDRAILRMLDKRLISDAGCSLIEHDLLAWLQAAAQQRLQMLELADLLDVTRGGLTRIVDRLVQRGWVQRDRPASNRREVHAKLTTEGQRAIERARATYVRLLTETLGTHLDDSELDQLGRITGKLHHALTGRACASRDLCP